MIDTDRELHIALPILTRQELAIFVEAAFGVVIPSTAICPGHVSPWEAFCRSYFATDSVVVWKASRGFGGKSHLLATLGNTEAVTLDANVTVLGGSGLQAQRVLEVQSQLWAHLSAPRDLLASEPAGRKLVFAAGNTVLALAASTRAARGPHPSRLRLDEVDEMQPLVFDAAMGQTMAMRDALGDIVVPAQTTISSTQQYADGMMARVLKDAAAKGWPVFEWCFKETAQPHGWNPESEIARKRAEVTEAMWEAEYLLQEPNPGSLAIDATLCDAMFDRSLGVVNDRPGEEFIFEAPEQNGVYAHGADWAKKQDYTVILTWRVDVRPMRLVAYRRGHRLPWPTMVGWFESRVKHYRSAPGAKWIGGHDATGLGDVIDDLLPGAWKAAQADELPIMEPVVMVGQRRADMLANYIAAIERGELRAPHIASMRGEHRYASHGDVFGSRDRDKLPDTIAAGAVAHHAIRRVRVTTAAHSAAPIAVGADDGEGVSYWRR